MKKKFKYIIVILVYRNTQDLKECIESINDNISNKKFKFRKLMFFEV